MSHESPHLDIFFGHATCSLQSAWRYLADEFSEGRIQVLLGSSFPAFPADSSPDDAVRAVAEVTPEKPLLLRFRHTVVGVRAESFRRASEIREDREKRLVVWILNKQIEVPRSTAEHPALWYLCRSNTREAAKLLGVQKFDEVLTPMHMALAALSFLARDPYLIIRVQQSLIKRKVVTGRRYRVAIAWRVYECFESLKTIPPGFEDLLSVLRQEEEGEADSGGWGTQRLPLSCLSFPKTSAEYIQDQDSADDPQQDRSHVHRSRWSLVAPSEAGLQLAWATKTCALLCNANADPMIRLTLISDVFLSMQGSPDNYLALMRYSGVLSGHLMAIMCSKPLSRLRYAQGLLALGSVIRVIEDAVIDNANPHLLKIFVDASSPRVRKLEDSILNAQLFLLADLHEIRSRLIDSSGPLFNFELFAPRLRKVDIELLARLAAQIGSTSHPISLFTGEKNKELEQLCPELILLRNAAFYMQLLQSNFCPQLKSSRPEDARLTFKATSINEFTVTIGDCVYPDPTGLARVSRSASSGSKYCARPESPLAVQTEEDVLYMDLQGDGTLTALDEEILLQIFTAPYTRVPLLLSFFDSRSRIRSLGDPKIQKMVRAAFFEPGVLQKDGKAPHCAPCGEMAAFATAGGVLRHEWRLSDLSPQLDQILASVLENDLGHYDASMSSNAILFVTKLVGDILAFTDKPTNVPSLELARTSIRRWLSDEALCNKHRGVLYWHLAQAGDELDLLSAMALQHYLVDHDAAERDLFFQSRRASLFKDAQEDPVILEKVLFSCFLNDGPKKIAWICTEGSIFVRQDPTLAITFDFNTGGFRFPNGEDLQRESTLACPVLGHLFPNVRSLFIPSSGAPKYRLVQIDVEADLVPKQKYISSPPSGAISLNQAAAWVKECLPVTTTWIENVEPTWVIGFDAESNIEYHARRRGKEDTLVELYTMVFVGPNSFRRLLRSCTSHSLSSTAEIADDPVWRVRALDDGKYWIFVPSWQLRGSLPDALLERFSFWERPGTNELVGFKGPVEHPATKEPNVAVRRLEACCQVEDLKTKWLLVNLQAGSIKYFRSQLDRMGVRISQALVWGDPNSHEIAHIELPLQNLVFTRLENGDFVEQNLHMVLLDEGNLLRKVLRSRTAKGRSLLVKDSKCWRILLLDGDGKPHVLLLHPSKEFIQEMSPVAALALLRYRLEDDEYLAALSLLCHAEWWTREQIIGLKWPDNPDAMALRLKMLIRAGFTDTDVNYAEFELKVPKPLRLTAAELSFLQSAREWELSDKSSLEDLTLGDKSLLSSFERFVSPKKPALPPMATRFSSDSARSSTNNPPIYEEDEFPYSSDMRTCVVWSGPSDLSPIAVAKRHNLSVKEHFWTVYCFLVSAEPANRFWAQCLGRMMHFDNQKERTAAFILGYVRGWDTLPQFPSAEALKEQGTNELRNIYSAAFTLCKDECVNDKSSQKVMEIRMGEQLSSMKKDAQLATEALWTCRGRKTRGSFSLKEVSNDFIAKDAINERVKEQTSPSPSILLQRAQSMLNQFSWVTWRNDKDQDTPVTPTLGIIERLEAIRDADDAEFCSDLESLLQLANTVPAHDDRAALLYAAGDLCGKQGPQWTNIADLFIPLCHPNFAAQLRMRNPHITDVQAKKIEQLLIELFQRFARSRQASRALDQEDHIAMLAESLRQSANGVENKLIEPTLLVFEFVHDILLRPSQVLAWKKLCEAAPQGNSLVLQLQMGEGKTSVVAPLLALAVSTPKKVLVFCVPKQLFIFTRRMLVNRLHTIAPDKPVVVFEYQRNDKVTTLTVIRLRFCLQNTGVVLCSATSLKSFHLRFLELFHLMDYHALQTKEALIMKATTKSFISSMRPISLKEDIIDASPSLEEEARRCCEIMDIFGKGLVLLDEVDILLHPLKSELHWPLGVKKPLDFTQGLGVSSSSTLQCNETRGLRWQVPMRLIDCLLNGPLAVQELLVNGVRQHKLMRFPHIVLMEQAYYRSFIHPLAIYLLPFLRTPRLLGKQFSENDLLGFLLNPTAKLSGPLSLCSDFGMQLLHLSQQWLHSLLPFILEKVNRVFYGLTEGRPLEEASSRDLLAVPFLGKDVASQDSEFAHPDIAIGFSILAYRYEGLRLCDFTHLVQHLQKQALMEASTPDSVGVEMRWRQWASSVRTKVTPLDLVDPGAWRDDLKKHAGVVEYWLHYLVFPRTMSFQDSTLSISGGDCLGRPLVFPCTLGFSGTPSDSHMPKTLPLQFEEQCNDIVLSRLCDETVITVVLCPQPMPQALLESVASGHFDALIDCGALVVGLSNEEAAHFIADRLPSDQFCRVLYFTSLDEPVNIEINSAAPRTFVFFDQVHSCGIDVQLPRTAQAALTIGRENGFRDYAQGAYRMRQLGKQKIVTFIPHQIERMILAHADESRSRAPTEFDTCSEGSRFDYLGIDGEMISTLCANELCTWLLVRQQKMDDEQKKVLTRQENAFKSRREALDLLKANIDRMGFSQQIGFAMDIMRGRVDWRVTDPAIAGYGRHHTVEKTKEEEKEEEREMEIEQPRPPEPLQRTERPKFKPAVWTWDNLLDPSSVFTMLGPIYLGTPEPDDRLWLSPNHSQSHRKKNALICIDWVRPSSSPRPLRTNPLPGPLHSLPDDPEALLHAFFKKHSLPSRNDELDLSSFLEECKEAFSPHEAHALQRELNATGGKCNWEDVRDAWPSRTYHVEQGRARALISLAEGEAALAALRKGVFEGVFGGLKVAILIRTNTGPFRLLDHTTDWRPPQPGTANAMEADVLLRFFDGETFADHVALEINWLQFGLRHLDDAETRELANNVALRRRRPPWSRWPFIHAVVPIRKTSDQIPSLETVRTVRVSLEGAASRCVWTSEGVLSRAKIISLWVPDTEVKKGWGFFRFSKPDETKRFSLGCAISEGVQAPPEVKVIEIKSSLGAKAIIDTQKMLCPHPATYRLMWSTTRSKSPLFVWMPIPPTKQFVACGCVVTHSQDPPDVTHVVCVPKTWTTPCVVRKVWDDQGSGGAKGSAWTGNATPRINLCQFMEGHTTAPSMYNIQPRNANQDLMNDLAVHDWQWDPTPS